MKNQDKPKYKNNCKNCIFLIHYHDNDLYICNNHVNQDYNVEYKITTKIICRVYGNKEQYAPWAYDYMWKTILKDQELLHSGKILSDYYEKAIKLASQRKLLNKCFVDNILDT